MDMTLYILGNLEMSFPLFGIVDCTCGVKAKQKNEKQTFYKLAWARDYYGLHNNIDR